jgi:DNA polymerase I
MTTIVDIETTGLSPHRDVITWVGFLRAGRLALLRHPDDRDKIQSALHSSEPLVAHNASFDFKFLVGAGYELPPEEYWRDTMFVAFVAGEQRLSLSLLQKQLIAEGVLDESILEPEARMRAWCRREKKQKGEAPVQILAPYLDADLRTTQAVWDHYRASLNGHKWVLHLEERLLPAVIAIEQRGMPLDVDYAKRFRIEAETEKDRLRRKVIRLGGRRLEKISTERLVEAFEARGADLSHLPTTPAKGLPALTKDTLSKVDDDLARTLLDFRRARKMADYSAQLFEHSYGDRLYGEFRQVGPRTGRMSSRAPNLQNLPRGDLRTRYCVRARPGHRLVCIDYDSMELRLLAAYAGEGALRAALAEGRDVHAETAERFGIGRPQAKALVYSIAYGAGGARIAEELELDSEDEGLRLRDSWYATFPEVKRLISRLWKLCEAGGFYNLLGRKHELERERRYKRLNYLIQGTGADIFKVAVLRMHEAGVPLIGLFHDEAVAEAPESEVETIATTMTEIMSRPLTGCGPAGERPFTIEGLPVDVGIHERWSEVKDPHFCPQRLERRPNETDKSPH